jgi:transposase InsO family protein
LKYTKPYTPQSNGRIERFWRTLYEDILDEAEFESQEALKDEFPSYLPYYNEHRPHQSLGNKTPAKVNNSCPRIC